MIYRRRSKKDGSTRYTVVIFDADNERKSVGTFATKALAQKAERNALHRRDNGEAMDDSRVTVRQTVEAFLERCKLERLAPTTIWRYEGLAECVYGECGAIPLAKLKPAHLTALYGKMTAKGWSEKTIRHLHGFIHAALEWAVDEREAISRNVAHTAGRLWRKRHKVGRSPARALTISEATKLLDAARGTPWRALFEFAILTGMRRGELAALQWSAIDEERRCVTVSRSLTKTKSGGQQFKRPKTGEVREVPLSERAIAVLKSHRAEQRKHIMRHRPDYDVAGDLVFADPLGQPWNLSAISNAFARLAKEAGLTGVRLHDLRHTCVSWAMEEGHDIKSVMRLAGHESDAMTLHYTHTTSAAAARAAESIGQRLASLAS